MGKLTIELSLVPVDMGAKPEIKISYLNIKNQHAIKMLTWSVTTTGARVELEIALNESEYLKKLLAYPPYVGSFLFGISLSMANPNVLFSPLYWDFLNAIVEGDRPNSTPKAYKAIKTDFIKIAVEVDETKVFDTLEKLFCHRYPVPEPNDIIENNIKESINNYQLALISPTIYQRFTFLFHSFEKAVNADGKDRKKKIFDKQASELTMIKGNEIEDIREFNNRIKHAIRTADDILAIEKGINNFSSLATKLKSATDKAILYRLDQRRL
jgi:hypothetical protein